MTSSLSYRPQPATLSPSSSDFSSIEPASSSNSPSPTPPPPPPHPSPRHVKTLPALRPGRPADNRRRVSRYEGGDSDSDSDGHHVSGASVGLLLSLSSPGMTRRPVLPSGSATSSPRSDDGATVFPRRRRHRDTAREEEPKEKRQREEKPPGDNDTPVASRLRRHRETSSEDRPQEKRRRRQADSSGERYCDCVRETCYRQNGTPISSDEIVYTVEGDEMP
ncbi:hypothetical protein XA68_14282 [Ophiocordyceps unilateralis]|uniref:Uncharacterized protein n=1 Tax=Ophiocordyceps unilateralis TaxID=268505 RepID=A0A2A9PN18_OPHUN|nr:hypothetical protein XA68_14282 [Ophiocordyceps unilateralis]